MGFQNDVFLRTLSLSLKFELILLKFSIKKFDIFLDSHEHDFFSDLKFIFKKI